MGVRRGRKEGRKEDCGNENENPHQGVVGKNLRGRGGADMRTVAVGSSPVGWRSRGWCNSEL